ncbi:MAG: S46 family peptidase, partial [Gammaproteobacteria bacterium]|nr:S46 family peptidase [Gammaproteobacteria bacterium]
MNSLFRLLVALLLMQAAYADEGMWQVHQLPQLSKQLEQLGLKLPPESLNDLTGYPMNAIVGLGGCSASFVSPEGLVVTNHHCIQQILQHNSTPENNLIEDGYLAENRAGELPGGPGNRILVTVEVSDVSTSMLDGVAADMDGLERHGIFEEREKKLIAECESQDGYRCGVHSFYEGLEFYLIKQLEIRDVRLVYAPPRSIGEYGGDIDNWMWPRHTGDYSFIRGYVSADGMPADHSEDNVPYGPEHYLTVSTKGLSDGDFTMAVGYPGRTYRHRLASEAEAQSNWYYPTRKKLYEDMLTIIERATTNRNAAAIKYSSLQQSLNNVIKNYDGMIEGFARSGLVQHKVLTEQRLSSWLKGPGDSAKSQSLDQLVKLIEEYRGGRELRMVYQDFLRRRAALLSAATQLYRLSKEKEKPDAEREPGYQERDWHRIGERLARLEKSFDKQVDRALLEHHLELYARLPNDQRIGALDRWFTITGNGINRKIVATKLDELYNDTSLDDNEVRMALLEASPEDFEASRDPFIRMAVALYENDLAREEEEKRYLGRFQYARSQYMSALAEWLANQGQALYADANGTLR